MGGLPPVFIEFIGHSKGVKTAVADVKAELATADAAGAGSFKKTGMLGKAAIAGIGLAAGAAALKTVHMAADFQTQMTRVRTGAGEAAANMKMVGQGVLAMAGQVGQSTSQLTAGLYMVESAGYHGADALNVLRNSAMGAKVGAADLHTVTDAVTTGLNAYKMSAGQAATVTNALIATEAEGKTNLEALAGSMASVLPTAAAAKIGLNEVLGAMATMTAQGTPAAVAATYLRQTIGALSNPSGKAAQEMQSLGLSAVKVGQNLGRNGLASTLTMLTDAIQRKMGPAGTVLIKHLQAAAHNTTAYQKVLAKLPPAQQTYIGALATMVGGTKSMQAALELTGPHMADFRKNTAGISEHVKAGGKNIEGWADVQKTFNQRMAQAKAATQAMAIQIGQYLMPAMQKIVSVIASAATWLSKHTWAAKAAAVVIGGVLVFALAAVTAQLYAMAAAAAVNPVTWIILAVVALIAVIVLLVMHWRAVWNVIKTVGLAVGHALAAAWRWLAAEATRIWKNDIAGPIMSAIHGVVDFFKKWWPLLLVIFLPVVAVIIAIWTRTHKMIESVAKTVWHAISSFLSGIWNAIASLASSIWGSRVRHAITDPFVAAYHLLSSIASKIGSAVSSGLHKAYDAVKAVGSWFSSIGSAIVHGIIHGVEGAAGGLYNSLKNLANNALSAAKSFLGINSPSKVFADEVGQSIPEGVAKGVIDNIPAVLDAVQGMSADAVKAAQSQAKHYLTLAGGAAKKEKTDDTMEDKWRKKAAEDHRKYMATHSKRYLTAQKNALAQVHKYAKLGADQDRLYKQYQGQYNHYQDLLKNGGEAPSRLSAQLQGRSEFQGALASQHLLAAMRGSAASAWSLTGSGAGIGSGHGTVVQQTTVNLNVAGSVRSDREIVGMVQQGLLTGRKTTTLPAGR
ncbi:MAG: phage tail tape measure protein [Streptosporangiaceae bacterium]